jgi:hypothetical protein
MYHESMAVNKKTPVDTKNLLVHNKHMKTAKMGRPPKPKGELRNLPLKIMVTAAERKALTSAAGSRGFSDWARATLLQIAGYKK